MNRSELPLYAVINLMNGQLDIQQDYSKFVMHPKYGLFAAPGGVTAEDIEAGVAQLPNVPTERIYSAIFNNERLNLDGVAPIKGRWLCDPITSVRVIENGSTVIITGESTVVVPEVLIRPVATGDDIDLLQLFSFVARDFAEKGFFTCADPAGLILLRRYLLQNRTFDGVIL